MGITREIFTGKEGRISSKRVLGALILFFAVYLNLDAHFTDRVLNAKAFDAMMYTGGIMIVGGVLEGKFTRGQQAAPDVGDDSEYK